MPALTSRAPTLPPAPRPRVAYYDLGIPFVGAVWNGFSITYDPANGHTLAWGAEFSQDGAHYFCNDLDTGRLEVFPMPCREHGPVFQAQDGTIYALIMSGLSADHGHHLMVFDAQARTFSSLGRPAPGDQRLLCMEERDACCTWEATNWPSCSATTRKSGALTNSAARLPRPPTA